MYVIILTSYHIGVTESGCFFNFRNELTFPQQFFTRVSNQLTHQSNFEVDNAIDILAYSCNFEIFQHFVFQSKTFQFYSMRSLILDTLSSCKLVYFHKPILVKYEVNMYSKLESIHGQTPVAQGNMLLWMNFWKGKL